ncbi:MAG TPA: acetyl-CoA carboxylase biotin carboxyl carrier protein [Gaiellales bacterium]|nr:acetyl-CoA carboxylase biotin carboxyl carrier protein [Gaiellales bacterium]
MTRIVDTTIRLLSQQPLVGTISTARVLEVAEILDQAGFAALEVSGGGCFDAAVQKGSESPWERIRGVKTRCRTTPLQMALRGRFLVGSRPLSDDLVRRFILCAAESGIEIFRLHDPLNDVENLESAAAAVREAGGRLYAGLAFSGSMPNLPRVVDKARRLAELGADHVLVHDPAGALDPGTCDRVINELAQASGLPVGLYCQGTGGNALAMAIEAARHGAEPIATAVLPVAYTLHRVAGEVLCDALTGLGLEHGVDADRVWEASRFIDEHVTSQMPALPIPPRITLRTAFNRLPVGLVSELDARLRMLSAADRLDEVLEEFKQVRLDCGVPPLAQPVGGILAGQAVRHVLSARRWDEVSPDMRDYLSGIYGNPPQAIAPEAAVHADPAAAVDPSPDLDQMRAEGLAASEEDLLLVALFGDDASRLLATLRGRGDREGAERDGLERSQSERIRELIEMVEGSDVEELTVEDAGVRITVRRQDDRPLAPVATAPAVASADNGAAEPAAPSVSQTVTVPSPMVGTFYRSPSPTAEPFVSEGDRVAVDQVLCVLEAMKLFNELKSEHAGVIRAVLVGNAEPVEYGQPLFELELA